MTGWGQGWGRGDSTLLTSLGCRMGLCHQGGSMGGGWGYGGLAGLPWSGGTGVWGQRPG